MMKQRKRLYNFAKTSNKDEEWAYHLVRNEVNSELESVHTSYCRIMFDNSYASNCRQFWKYI